MTEVGTACPEATKLYLKQNLCAALLGMHDQGNHGTRYLREADALCQAVRYGMDRCFGATVAEAKLRALRDGIRQRDEQLTTYVGSDDDDDDDDA